MGNLLIRINQLVWGMPALLLVVGVGVYLTVRTGGVQFLLFPKACKEFVLRLIGRGGKTEGTSGFRALCTALAATVGTGNLAGVAGAITLGGPGSIFWMWICGFLGMVTKYAEAVLAVRYRTNKENGQIFAGPMYIIQNAMGNRWRWLAGCYCFFGVVAAFGVGNATQINAVVGGINSAIASFGGGRSVWTNLTVGCMLAVLIWYILRGGADRIGVAAERLVPFAALFYLMICVGVLLTRYQAVPEAFRQIFQGAFHPKAVTGGVVGSLFSTLRIGASRGVFTNEAGLGTAAIVHGTADVSHPVEQGLMGIMEVFIDTIVICTVTALVILCSGIPIPYGTDGGAELTTDAFAQIYGSWICIPLTFCLCLFAVATILGWGLYGARCAQYLFGDGAWKPFTILQVITVIFGAIMGTRIVWVLAETVNGFMLVPNLIALGVLTPEVCVLTKQYKRKGER